MFVTSNGPETTMPLATNIFNIKVHLGQLLREKRMTILYQGFPFRYVYGQGSTASLPQVSYESYETPEEVDVPTPSGYNRHVVTFSYKCAKLGWSRCNPSKDDFYVWSLSISPELDSRLSYRSSINSSLLNKKIIVAEVVVDPVILNSEMYYAQYLRQEPDGILYALEASLLSGTTITTTTSTSSLLSSPYSPYCSSISPLCANPRLNRTFVTPSKTGQRASQNYFGVEEEASYMATYRDGRQEFVMSISPEPHFDSLTLDPLLKGLQGFELDTQRLL